MPARRLVGEYSTLLGPGYRCVDAQFASTYEKKEEKCTATHDLDYYHIYLSEQSAPHPHPHPPPKAQNKQTNSTISARLETYLDHHLRDPAGCFDQGRYQSDVHVHVQRGEAHRGQPEEVHPGVAQVAVQDRLEARGRLLRRAVTGRW